MTRRFLLRRLGLALAMLAPALGGRAAAGPVSKPTLDPFDRDAFALRDGWVLRQDDL